jgi:hypothetical protein
MKKIKIFDNKLCVIKDANSSNYIVANSLSSKKLVFIKSDRENDYFAIRASKEEIEFSDVINNLRYYNLIQ